jgi:thymidine phosphorylase
MWTSDKLSQAGASLATTIGGFIAASKQAKSDKKWQKYNNAMVRIQEGMNQNALTTNENIMREQHLEKIFNIQKSQLATTASVEVQAAASGTIGRSVNHVLFDVARNAAQARQRADEEFEYQKVGIDSQRINSAMNAQLSLDLRKISGPSPITAALGFLGDLGKLSKQV